MSPAVNGVMVVAAYCVVATGESTVPGMAAPLRSTLEDMATATVGEIR